MPSLNLSGEVIYFAHPVSDYGTDFERAVVADLEATGASVVNPNHLSHQEAYSRVGMGYFIRLCSSASVCAFLRFPDWSLGAGVAREVESFLERQAQVYEVIPTPLAVTRFSLTPCRVLPNALSVEQTRVALRCFRDLSNGGR